LPAAVRRGELLRAVCLSAGRGQGAAGDLRRRPMPCAPVPPSPDRARKARSFQAVGLPLLVHLQPRAGLLLRPFLRRGYRLLLPLDGLVELSQLGVGGREGGHLRWPLCERVSLAGGFEGLRPVANLVVGAAGTEQRQGGVVRGGIR